MRLAVVLAVVPITVGGASYVLAREFGIALPDWTVGASLCVASLVALGLVLKRAEG